MPTLCATRGCYFKIKPYERYCLCCRLDMDIESEVPLPYEPPARSFSLAGVVQRADGISARCINRSHRTCAGVTCRCSCHQRVGAA